MLKRSPHLSFKIRAAVGSLDSFVLDEDVVLKNLASCAYLSSDSSQLRYMSQAPPTSEMIELRLQPPSNCKLVPRERCYNTLAPNY